MEVTPHPCHSSPFIFSSELSSPRGRWAGSQARPKLGEVGQPQAEGPSPPHLTVHFPRPAVRAGAQEGRGEGRWEEALHRWPPHKTGGSSPRSREGTSQELQSIPWDRRLRKRGKKGAASGLRVWGDREKNGQETRCTEEEPCSGLDSGGRCLGSSG